VPGEGRSRDDIDPPTEQILRIHQECTEGESRRLGAGFDEQIHVAVFIRIVARHRPEDFDGANSVSLCQRPQFFAMDFDKPMHLQPRSGSFQSARAV